MMTFEVPLVRVILQKHWDLKTAGWKLLQAERKCVKVRNEESQNRHPEVIQVPGMSKSACA